MRELVDSAPTVFNEIISCTTRSPREGEEDGVNYHFISPLEFLSLKKKGQLLEWAKFNDWYYGTEVNALTDDKVNIGVFNPEGIVSLLRIPFIDLKIVYVKADDKIRLLRQLYREEHPDIKEIIRRFNTDEHDFVWMEKTADYCLVNNSEEDKEYAKDLITILCRLWAN